MHIFKIPPDAFLEPVTVSCSSLRAPAQTSEINQIQERSIQYVTHRWSESEEGAAMSAKLLEILIIWPLGQDLERRGHTPKKRNMTFTLAKA